MKKIIILLIICLGLTGCNKNNKMEILLKGNLLGYNWIYEIEDEKVLKSTDITYDKNETENFLFEFKSKREGKTSITFKYLSPNKEELYKLIYVVSVDKNKNIELASKTGTYLTEIIPDVVIK